MFEKKKTREEEKTLPVEPDEVRSVRRVDYQEHSDSSGDDDYAYTDTEEKVALDIVARGNQYYVVCTKTYYGHSYDRYESPMNTYSERVTLEICPIEADRCGQGKDELLAYMNRDNAERIWGGCDTVSRPTESFVVEQVTRALKKHAGEARVMAKKERGECKPNAVYISYSGEPRAIYIDDFTTNEGLAMALDCDDVHIGTMGDEDDAVVAYFYNAKVRYGIPYNRVASALFDACLEGAVVTCGWDAENDVCVPMDPDDVKAVVKLIKVKKAMLHP